MYYQWLFIGFLLASLTSGAEFGSRLTLGAGGICGDGRIIKNCEVGVSEDDGKNLSCNSEQQSVEGSGEDEPSTPSSSVEGIIPYSSVVTWLVKKIKKNKKILPVVCL